MASPLSRRRFLQSTALAGTALSVVPTASASGPRSPDSPLAPIRPRRLRAGDTVALIAPAGIVRQRDVDESREAMERLGLRTVVGRHVLNRHGYLAGTDPARAEDLMIAFQDDAITGLVAIRGGWGCARLLPFLDWTAIRANPKVVIGYSDVTSLLLAMYARAGVVGYHGPVATSSFSRFTLDAFRPVVFESNPVDLAPEAGTPGLSVIRHGTARGPLVGGNLTVLAAMVGTPYLPSFEGHILFLEDIGESVYRVDRMLTQLAQAGLLSGLAGFVMGSCRGCTPEADALGSFELSEVVRQHVEPLGIPALMGAPIGHVTDKWTLPLGVMAELHTETGALRLAEAPVL